MDTNKANNKQLLIEKLYQQLQENADDSKILITAQLLVSTLQSDSKKSHKGITVVSPGYTSAASTQIVAEEQTARPQQAEKTLSESPKPNPEKKKPLHSRLIEKELSFFQIYKEDEKSKTVQQSLFGETPAPAVDLNEKLKSNKREIGESHPIRDLKSGIGINDRYLFINELFRGDATAYERSILTINNFTSLKESTDWIERELRITYFWDEKDKVVNQFLQLVKRRFA